MSLWLISENEAQVDYFLAHGVVPTSVILNPSYFRSMAVYLGTDADLLVVIHGFTTFKVSEINQLCRDLIEFRDNYKEVTIMSDVPLTIPFDYYLYEGDLFEGSIKFVSEGKAYAIDSLGNAIYKPNKNTVYAKGNVIMQKFAKYHKQENDETLRSQVIRPKGVKSVALPNTVENALLDSLVCFEKKEKDL